MARVQASKAAGGGDAARAELGLGQDDWSGSSVAQRERLHQTTNRVSKTGERIKQSKATLLEVRAPRPLAGPRASAVLTAPRGGRGLSPASPTRPGRGVGHGKPWGGAGGSRPAPDND